MNDRSGRVLNSSPLAMPAIVRGAVYLLVGIALLGGLYLIAVRGDVLLSDLSALVALICG